MYFIYMHENYEDNGEFVGWYKNKDQAIDCVTENMCDLNETIYDYACIQTIPEGIYNPSTENNWFIFDYETKKYEPTKSICNEKTMKFYHKSYKEYLEEQYNK